MTSSNESDTDDGDNPSCPARGKVTSPEPVLLLNRQRAVKRDWDGIRIFLQELASRTEGTAFSVCLVSDRAMRRYNRRFRRQDKTTDVLSFPAGDPAYLGDIVISVETARENAVRYGLPLDQEIKVLALHGLLHLMGYNHEADDGEMARVEKLWSARLGLPSSLTMRAGKSRTRAVAGGPR